MRAAAHGILFGARSKHRAARRLRPRAEDRGAALDPAQRKLLENALRDFRLAGGDLRAGQKNRYRRVAQRPGHFATKFSGKVVDAGRAYARNVTHSAEIAGLPTNAVDRAAVH